MGAYVLVPQRFDPLSLPRDLRRQTDAAHLVLGAIAARADASSREALRNFVPMATKSLRRFVSDRHLAPLFRSLQTLGWIETDGIYLPQHLDRSGVGKAQGYRLSDQSIGPLRAVEIRDADKAERLTQSNLPPEELLTRRPAVRYLLGWLEKLTIDLPAAEAILNADPAADELAEFRRSAHLFLCVLIDSGVVELSEDRHGRLHSIVSRLPRAVRPLLHIGGEQVVELDISAAQPALLVSALRRAGGDPVLFRNLSFSSAAESLPLTGAMDDEAFRFAGLCKSGRLYESLIEQADSRGPSHTTTREDAKRGAMYWLNARLAMPGIRDEPVVQSLLKGFPALSAFLENVKAPDHRIVSHVLQRAESSIVIDRIVGRLAMERPEMPVATIHDALLVPPDDAAEVKAVVDEELATAGVPSFCRIKS